jgi:hypothetical protein
MKTQGVGRRVASRRVCVSVASSTFHSCVCRVLVVVDHARKKKSRFGAAGNPVRNEQAKSTVSCVSSVKEGTFSLKRQSYLWPLC